jgi:hypothetical protein
MKKGGINELQKYNKDFKQWQLKLAGRVPDKETIKAYLSGLDSKILLAFVKEGYYKKFKTLTKWQLAAETIIAKYDKNKVGKESTAGKTKLVRPPLPNTTKKKFLQKLKKDEV